MTDEPKDPEKRGDVLQLVPKNVKELQQEIQKDEDVFIRKQRCWFKNNYTTEGCSCNYCIYFNMMGQRVYEMIVSDLNYQGKRGSMIFSTQDIVEILQISLERVIAFENKKGPKK